MRHIYRDSETLETLIKVEGQSPSLIRRLKSKFKLSKGTCHIMHARVLSIVRVCTRAQMRSSLVVVRVIVGVRSILGLVRLSACALDPKYSCNRSQG
jgi:hypothetical protein